MKTGHPDIKVYALGRQNRPKSTHSMRESDGPEELEATIAVDGYLTTVEYDYPTFHLSMRCYACHVVGGHLVLLEHSAAKWLDAASLDSVDWLPADVAVVDAIRNQALLGD